jgi:hypothetical protein
LEPEEIDEATQAERLARRMRARLEDLLSRNAKVTALALELYDPKLPTEIAKAWKVVLGKGEADAEREDEDIPKRP